nr:MAG TPA: hypothetical protein [Caudoviricetes sp.]
MSSEKKFQSSYLCNLHNSEVIKAISVFVYITYYSLISFIYFWRR